MDKKNLYYVVKKGTNARTITLDKRPLIMDSEAADLEIKAWAPTHEKITIADFEERFVDKDGK